jgi:hypothetical protein
MKNLSLKKLIVCLFTVFAFVNCNKKKLSAEVIVINSIEKHGGFKNWNSLKIVSFDKNVILFLKDGSIESATKKYQEFRFHPELEGKITWNTNNEKSLILYKKGKVTKFVNDSLITNSAELQKAKNSFNAALYIISQPFNFLNESTKLTYLGVANLENKEVHEIKVGYTNDTAASDKWFYYFDVTTFKMVANKVILKDHTSLVENSTFNTTTDFIFNQSRKSYRLNDNGDKTYLRATYFYDNFKTEYQ